MSFFRQGSDSERRRVQWDLDAGAGNYLALVCGQLGGAALGFISVWLAARALGSDGYGGIVAFIAASQLVGQAALHWTAISLFRHGCREFIDEGRIASAFWNRLAILAGNVALVLFAAPWWLPRVSALFSLPAGAQGLVLLHILATALSIHTQQALSAAKLPRFQSLLSIAERGAIALSLLVVSFSGAATWRLVAVIFTLAPLLSMSLALFRLRRFILPPRGLDFSLLQQMIRFSYPLLFFSVVGYLTTNHLDAVFILRFLSASDLGVYGLAYQLAGMFMQLSSLGGSLFMAFFITSDALEGEGDGKPRERFFRSLLPTLVLAWSSAAALAAILFSCLLDFFFHSSFQGARTLIWPLMGAAALAAPVTIAFGPAANARSRTSIAALAALAAAVVNTVLNFVLIPRFGLMGCAWATTAAFATSLLVFLALAPRQVSTPRSWTFYGTLPMLVGAAVVPRAGEWGALAATLASGGLIAVLRRRDVAHTLHTLAELPAFKSLQLWRAAGLAREETP